VVAASYDGDTKFHSAVSDQRELDIKALTTTAVTLSAPRVTYGNEKTENLTVRVTGHFPAGTLTLKADRTVLGMFPLDPSGSGSASKALAATQLKPGRHTITVSYAGDDVNVGSSSHSKTIIVAAEPTTTALTLSTAKVKVGHEQAEKLTVTVKPAFTGPAPAGKVTIKVGSTTVCTVTLTSAAKGMVGCNLATGKLKPGKYTLTAAYTAVTPYTGSTSVKTLTVTK
jgi:hypothetical protein